MTEIIDTIGRFLVDLVLYGIPFIGCIAVLLAGFMVCYNVGRKSIEEES